MSRMRQVIQLEIDYDPDETSDPRKWDWDDLIDVPESDVLLAGWSRPIEIPDTENNA